MCGRRSLRGALWQAVTLSRRQLNVSAPRISACVRLAGHDLCRRLCAWFYFCSFRHIGLLEPHGAAGMRLLCRMYW